MDIYLNMPKQVKIIQDTFLFRHPIEIAIDRPVQAWQWMNQTRSIPDQCDWVRQDVSDSWRRCLEDFHLPLGKYSNWNHYEVQRQTLGDNADIQTFSRIISNLGNNFDFFLKEAGVMLVLTRSDGALLYTLGDPPFSCPFIERLFQTNASWSEAVVGNNGIGSAAQLKKPIAFQGMEHFLSALHPFTTVGYPILDDNGEVLAVIGLISDHLERMSSLFAFLHLICVLINTNLPLAQSQAAQARVLEKIPMKPAKKQFLQHDPDISPELKALVNKAVKLQQHKIPILITGESGVGKDHFVQLLKTAGPRHDQALIAINCASIPHDLIESELFGYEAGSFTGAKSNGKPGKFLLANNGILFLDEIGDMNLDLQTTLLRVLESSEFTPIGGTKPIRVDVQIVAATNVRLLQAVEEGRFRRDLYYRLNGAQIHLQPLRERSDKNLIIHHILQRELSKLQNSPEISIAPDVIELIEQHPWPGNIRQLINVIRATIYTAGGTLITREDLPLDFIAELNSLPSATAVCTDKSGMVIAEPPRHGNNPLSLLDWEKYGIKTTLQECEGNISIAAKKLGITRTTLYKKIDQFGLKKMGNMA